MLSEMFWRLQPALPQGGGGAGGASGASPSGNSVQGCGMQAGMLAVMFAVFYFLMIRPQQKRAREQEAMLKALKPGDIVRTTGGIRGEIVDIQEKEITLLVAEKVKLNVLRSHVTGAETSSRPGSA